MLDFNKPLEAFLMLDFNKPLEAVNKDTGKTVLVHFKGMDPNDSKKWRSTLCPDPDTTNDSWYLDGGDPCWHKKWFVRNCSMDISKAVQGRFGKDDAWEDVTVTPMPNGYFSVSTDRLIAVYFTHHGGEHMHCWGHFKELRNKPEVTETVYRITKEGRVITNFLPKEMMLAKLIVTLEDGVAINSRIEHV